MLCFKRGKIGEMVDENVNKLINEDFYRLKNGDVKNFSTNLGKNIVSAYDILMSLDPQEIVTIYLKNDGKLIMNDNILINGNVKDFLSLRILMENYTYIIWITQIIYMD